MIVLGAAGRDFHDFNVVFRDDPQVDVVAFTATQIPGIADRRYPRALAGPRYPGGIPIEPEDRLEHLIRAHAVDTVVFSYSDVSHVHVMHLASRALAAGAGFELLAPRRTMLRSTRPVVSVCAVRTGCGKGAVARRIARILRARGRTVAVVRHPMPYGDLAAARVQRFASFPDLDAAGVTLEEREEYEPHLEAGSVVFAGVDYEAILRAAEHEADVILWDGGNNDLPFFRPTRHFCLVDPHRAGDESTYHPGEANLRMADVVVITKEDSAPRERIDAVRRAARLLAPSAPIVDVAFPLTVDAPEAVRGRRVLAVDDGPTLTHGGMSAGAGELAARRLGATLVDPRPYAVGSLQEVFRTYPALGPVLPAMGYSESQRAELAATINATPCEAVVVGTPLDLRHVLTVRHPTVRVRYEAEERGATTFEQVLEGL